MHPLDNYSLYESLDGEAPHHHHKPGSRPPRNFCACVKNTLLIALGVAIVLGLLVIVPLKVIFDEPKGVIKES